MIQNLIANDPRHLKALLAGDGIHNHVAVDADEVFGIEDAVFILERGGEVVSGCLLLMLHLSFKDFKKSKTKTSNNVEEWRKEKEKRSRQRRAMARGVCISGAHSL